MEAANDSIASPWRRPMIPLHIRKGCVMGAFVILLSQMSLPAEPNGSRTIQCLKPLLQHVSMCASVRHITRCSLSFKYLPGGIQCNVSANLAGRRRRLLGGLKVRCSWKFERESRYTSSSGADIVNRTGHNRTATPELNMLQNRIGLIP